jgi:Putative Ig domain
MTYRSKQTTFRPTRTERSTTSGSSIFFFSLLLCLTVLGTACGTAASGNSTTAATATLGPTIAPTRAVPLAIVNSALTEAEAGVPYAASLSASGGVAPYHWSLAAGSLPPGIHLEAASGAISGTTALSGSYSFTAKVTDSSRHLQVAGLDRDHGTVSYGQSATIAITLTVSSTLTMANAALAEADAGTPYAAWLSAIGGVPPYQWSLATGSLPSGIALQASNGTIVGMTALSGAYPFTAKVTDFYGQSATLPLNLTVSSTLAIANSVFKEAEAGMPYEASLSAAGGIPPYRWSLSNGTLPSGIQLQTSNGTIMGTTALAGSYSFTAQVTDSYGQSATLPTNLTVSLPLAIGNATLPAANASTPYTASLSAAGGIAPYQWSLANGTLPSGIQLQASDGTITGTTALAGSYPFTAQVTDSYGYSATAALSLTVSPNSAGGYDGPAALPKVYVQTAMANTTATGPIVWVQAGDSLQSALNAAVCGETLMLAAGTSYSGIFLFPNHNCTSNSWIIVRTSSSDMLLPPETSRLTPCYSGVASLPGRPVFNCPSVAVVTAQIVAPSYGSNGMGPVVFAPGASYYRLVGLEVTRASGIGSMQTLISSQLQNGVPSAIHNIVLDRMWVHGDAQEDTSRGIWLTNLSYISVIDSTFTDFHCVSNGSCSDSQVMSGGSGYGPFKIDGNFLEASGENIMFGGESATSTPADIQITNNHFFKPLVWLKGQVGFVGGTNGNPFIVKNLLELKNAQRVLVDGNIMENCWGGFSQVGFAILITPKNQSGSNGSNICPICQVTDVVVRYNIVSHVGAGLQIANALSDNGGAPLDGQRYSIHDIVIDDIDGLKYDGPSEFAQMSVSPGAPLLQNVSINHVTAFSRSFMFIIGDMVATSGPMKNFVFTNSIVNAGSYPVWSTGGGTANCAYYDIPLTTFDACFTNSAFAADAIVGASSSYPPADWPSDNYFPASVTSVQFVNYNGGNGGDYHLQSSSPYKGKGTDGEDLGADMDALDAAILGVE